MELREKSCQTLPIYPLFYRIKDTIQIFINGDDCIPRLSIANMANIITMVQEIDNVPITNKELLKIFLGHYDDEVNTKLDELGWFPTFYETL